MATAVVKYKMTTRPGVVLVTSRTRLGHEHGVTMATCTCEHFTLSRREDRWREGHIAAAITQDNTIPLPTGNWVQLTDEQVALLDEEAERQKAARA